MKTMLSTLFAILVGAASSLAAPALLVESTVTEHRSNGDKDFSATPRITVESGKQASVQINQLEYAITPTLLSDGTVETQVVLTHHDGHRARTIASPRITAKLGQVAEIKSEKFAIKTKTSLAK